MSLYLRCVDFESNYEEYEGFLSLRARECFESWVYFCRVEAEVGGPRTYIWGPDGGPGVESTEVAHHQK